MTRQATVRAYWIATSLFALLLLMDGIGGLTHAQAGVESLTHLGYPLYLLDLIGAAKILAAIAIVQTRFVTIKEWAFAGFAISCVGALWSRMYVGDGFGLVILPVIFLAIMLVPYVLWKKVRQLAEAGPDLSPLAGASGSAAS
ncbi:MAG: DoxX family protein [Gammaproteobacteria bacterium]|nr:DoxX family protein [Gammaproteobacteria bacterium]